jgi:hypothetical protein
MNTTDSSIEIALKHIKTALIFLPVFFVVMFFDYKSFNGYFFMNYKIIALTHIFTLGFLLMVIMGASYMLLPVALGVKIAYEKLFIPVYYGYVISLLLFVIGMHYSLGVMIAAGGILLFVSVLTYNLNIFASLKKVKKWDYSSLGIAFAYFYLFIGISVGLYLALSFKYKIGLNIYYILQDHIYLMFVGFVMMLFIGVSYRLLPMFYMTKAPDNLYWKTDLTVINAGIIAMLASSFFGNGSAVHIYLNEAGGWLLGAGILLYCYIFFALMLKRIKKKFDITTFYLYAGIIFLVAAVFLGLIINAVPQEKLFVLIGVNGAYYLYYIFAFLGLFGFAGMVIIGFLHKIFPFLISLKTFEKAKKGAYGKLFSDLKTKYFEYVIFAMFLAGSVLWIFYLIQLASAVLFAASLLLLLHIFSMGR